MSWRKILAQGATILALGLLDALGIWAFSSLLLRGEYWMAAGLAVALGLINWIYFSKRTYPLKYLFPGLFFLVLFVLYPIGYNIYIAFTNYGTGHILSKKQAITQIESRLYLPPDAETFGYVAFQEEGGTEFAFLFYPKEGPVLFARAGRLVPVAPGDPGFLDQDGDGIVDGVEGYRRLGLPEVVQNLSTFQAMEFPYGERILRMTSLQGFAAFEHRYRYDPENDVMVDLLSGTVYRPMEGFFTSQDGKTLLPGFTIVVGWRNFFALVTNPQISGPFFQVFAWTFAYAFFSVLLTFALGLFLAYHLNNPYLRFRRAYRMLLIVPYAIPAFISVLMWRGFFNTEVGVFNQILYSLFEVKIPWLQDPFWAKVALLLNNLWLGFPYMMIISLGALQSIPEELHEAAQIDGASAWQRFWRITFPLLLVSLAPLLIGSFAFNFNNFTNIYLLTEGRPPIPGAQTPAGSTDILISYTYRLAFEGQRGNQYGLASAVSILIFLIIGTISWINFRFTRALEEVSENV